MDRLALYKHYNAIHQALYSLGPGELSSEPVMVMVVVVVGLPNVVCQWILQKINIVCSVTISGMLNTLHNFSLRRQKHSPFGNQVFKVCMCVFQWLSEELSGLWVSVVTRVVPLEYRTLLHLKYTTPDNHRNPQSR